jgi:protein SCO1
MQKAKAVGGGSQVNRRLLLGGSVAALGIGVGALQHLQAQQHPNHRGPAAKSHKRPEYHGRHGELVAAAQACLAKGEVCMRHCIAALSTGDTSLVDCLKTVTAMLPICQALERYAIIDARHLRELSRLSTTVNTECEAECRRHADHHNACKDCADACAACVSACNKLNEQAGARAPFQARNFQLTTHTGAQWRSAGCAGQPAAMLFGYTHCPVVCPIALLKISNALAVLGPAVGPLQVLFATVDPEKDTPEQLRQYLADFDPRITGLTGQVGEIDLLAGAFGAHVSRGSIGGREIAHSTSMYLLDRTGNIVSELPDAASEEQQVAALRALVA